jgi:hypothetical protein
MWPVALPTVQILLNHMVMWVFWVKWANTPSSCLISWYKLFPRELFICQDISLIWNMEVQDWSWDMTLCHCMVFSTISEDLCNFIFKVKQSKTNWTVCHWRWRWHDPSKWWELLIQHHSVTHQKCESSASLLCETQVSRDGGSPLSTKVNNFVSFWS